MLAAASKFLRQIVPPVIATLVAALLIAGFNRAFTTHLTQPRMAAMNMEASAPAPAKERVMTEVAPPILAEFSVPLRELDKSGEREAAKDQGAVKLAEVTPAAPPVPVPAPPVRKTEPRQAESRPVETRQIETRHAEMARPVEVRPVAEPRVAAPVVVQQPPPPPAVTQQPLPPVIMQPVPAAPPPVIVATPVVAAPPAGEPLMVTVPDRPRAQPLPQPETQLREPPAPQSPIGAIVNTLKPSSLFARAREFGEKIEAAGNEILPNIRN